MTKTARVYKIEMLIRTRGCVSFATLLTELEVSAATLKRDLEYLRGQLGAPIEYDRYQNGYKFGAGYRGERHELPGLWFNERELYSLLMAHQLLSELDGEGVLSRHLQPLLDRVHEMLGASESEAKTIVKRVKIISAARRPVPTKFFELVGEALVNRRRLQIRYLTRGRGEVTDREVSPQRLVHYRNTWYLDAWCHRSEDLRRFALDAIEEASLLDARAKEFSLKEVEAEMDGGYGIYAGANVQWATLVFESQAAQWVSREEWHPEQQGRWLEGGRYELKIPYANATEITMDVMRHGDQVQVVEPQGLAAQIGAALKRAAAAYTGRRGLASSLRATVVRFAGSPPTQST
jgi:predicted DNA-binding transcriptional regulator YafY